MAVCFFYYNIIFTYYNIILIALHNHTLAHLCLAKQTLVEREGACKRKNDCLSTPCCKKHDTEHTEDTWTDPPLWSQLNTTSPCSSPEKSLLLFKLFILSRFLFLSPPVYYVWLSFPVPFVEFLNDFPVTVSTTPNPPLSCLCHCVWLYYNSVPAVDKCCLSSLFPIDRNERKGETSDWASRLPSLTPQSPALPIRY